MQPSTDSNTFAAWQSLSPSAAARQVAARITSLDPRLRRASIAWQQSVSQLEEQLGSAPPGPLRGVPYALKDLFDLAGVPTRAGSIFLQDERPLPGNDSALVKRFRSAGATAALKSHLVEFASGLFGDNPHHGDCPHPLHPDRLTGGSSSGSVALVAAGVVPLAIGTDTGGSVRVPAAFCGLHGFRMTPGDELIRDAFPLSPSFDTAGWFTSNPADLLTVNRALIGEAQAASGQAAKGCHLPLDAFVSAPDAEVARATTDAASRYCPEADADTRALLLDSWRDAVESYGTISMTEAHRVHAKWLAPYRAEYDPVIWQRFSDAGLFEAERLQRAQDILQKVRRTWSAFFERYAYLVLPASPAPAPRKADCTPVLRRDILTLTAPASLGGLPVLTVPVVLPSGLTCGIQIIAATPDSPVFASILRSA